MSSLLRSLHPLRASSRALARPTAATLHTSSARCALNEAERDSHSSDSERGNKIEKEKSDSVSKAQSGQGEWKPELASQSEQIMQGEKSNMSMKEMQKMGEKKAEEGKKPSGSS